MKTRLSVNVNKIALIRNARGNNFPDLLKVCKDIESYGAEGITVHPRPDERHITYADIPLIKEVCTTEFNIEGNPRSRGFMDLVIKNKPHQCTLVPDEQNALTSDAGWNTLKHLHYLQEIIQELKANNIRVSIFCDPDPAMIEAAKKTGTDRIELYTGPYSDAFNNNKNKAVEPYRIASEIAKKLELGLNAGHDLNLNNLAFFKKNTIDLAEVSIGHALVVDALYYGLHNTIELYKNKLI